MINTLATGLQHMGYLMVNNRVAIYQRDRTLGIRVYEEGQEGLRLTSAIRQHLYALRGAADD